MKIDFDQKILGPSGGPVKMTPESTEDATLASFASTALFASLDSDRGLDGLTKAKIGALGLKLFNGGEQDITPEDAALIRERVGQTFPPMFVARVYEAIQ